MGILARYSQSMMILTVLFFLLSVLSLQVAARKTITRTAIITVNESVFALPEDEAAIEINNPTVDSALLVDGLLANLNPGGNGKAVIRYQNLSNRFQVQLGQLSQLVAAGPVHGILIDNGGVDPEGKMTAFGLVLVDGEAVVEGGHFFHFTVPARGILQFGENARIKAKTITQAAITSEDSDSILQISTSGVLKATSGSAFDFSSSNGRLLMQVNDGEITGRIKGFKTPGTTDLLRLTGGTIDSVSGIERLAIPEHGKTGLEIPTITGNVLPDSSGSNALMTVHGSLVLDSSGSPQQLQLNADVQLAERGNLVITVPENALSSAPLPVTPVKVTGDFVTAGTAKPLGITPSEKAYKLLLQNNGPLDFKILQVNASDVSALEQKSLINTSVLVNLEALVEPGVDDTFEVTLAPKSPAEIRKIIEDAGGGKGSQEALLTMISKVENELIRKEQLPPEIKPVYDVIASIPVSEPDQLLQLARESRINNSLTHEVINISRRKTFLQINRRMRSHTEQGSDQSGKSYGDISSENGLWLEFMKTDGHSNTSINSVGDRILGFALDLNTVSLGYDFEHDGLVLGAALTHGNAYVNKHDSVDYSQHNIQQLTLYGGRQYQDWYLEIMTDAGKGKHKRFRYLDGVFSTPLQAEFSSSSFGTRLIGSKALRWRKATLEPQLGLGYSRVRTGSYREQDSGATGFGQAVKSMSYQRIEAGIGFSLRQTMFIGKGSLEPEFQMMVWHDFKGDQPATISQLVSGSDELRVKGVFSAQTRYEALLNFQYRREDNLIINFGYGQDFDKDYQSHHYLMKLQYNF